MEQNSAENPVINPKALVITLLILLCIPVVYVLFIKEDAAEPAPATTEQTTQPANPAPPTTEATETPPTTAPGTTEQIENLKKAIAGNPTESNYLNLGMAYYYNKQYPECIVASRAALGINPNNALAYNNICSAFNSMSMWDSAIVAGQEALRLKPDFQLAKNNLNWALDMKKKQ